MKYLQLSKGFEALVDDSDFNLLSQFKWSVDQVKRGRPAGRARINGRMMFMHRFILNAPIGIEVDHVNHNTLDNRRSNLRLCSRSGNVGNRRKRSDISNKEYSSKYKGVFFETSRKKWTARGREGLKRVFLGRFNAEDDAAKAYDKWASIYFGDFAFLNFP